MKNRQITLGELKQLVEKGLGDDVYVQKYGLGRAIERLAAELFVGDKKISPKETKIIKSQLKQFLKNRTFDVQTEGF